VPAAWEPVTAEAAAEVTCDAVDATCDAIEVTPEATDAGADGKADSGVVAACAWRENTKKTMNIPAATIATCITRRAMRRKNGSGMNNPHSPGNQTWHAPEIVDPNHACPGPFQCNDPGRT
jgi:hypothetical protein